MLPATRIWKINLGDPEAAYPSNETPRPKGKRPPDGIIWAHNPHDFYHATTCTGLWSRSMIEELGGKLPKNGKETPRTPEPSPRRLDPWSPPNLHLPSKKESTNDGMAGTVSETPLPASGSDSGIKLELPLVAASEGTIEYRLQEHIPKEDLPHIITINDPRAETTSPTKYMRVIPKPDLDRDSSVVTTPSLLPGSFNETAIHTAARHTAARVAEIDLTDDLGDGNHSSVSRATIQFPGFAIPVSVAVKIASPGSAESDMLEHEAQIYNVFRQHLSEDWSGYHHIEEALYDGDGIVPVKAIVPKFYGYYVPMADELAGRDKRTLRPLIILEDCGKPINPRALTVEQRTECYSMIFRLHTAGFVQNSFYPRNVLVQPGPLTEPPHKRSKDTPSFRIIDFGRCERWKDLQKTRKGRALKEWNKMVKNEKEMAKNTIYGEVSKTVVKFAKFRDDGRLSPARHAYLRPYKTKRFGLRSC